MSVFKCKRCGGTIEFQEGTTVGVCDSCGTKQTLPRLDDDRRRKAANKLKKVIAVVIPIVIVCTALAVLTPTVIIPTFKYSAAVELYNEEKYDEAIAAFEALNGYKDSAAQIAKCEDAIQNTKYSAAAELYNEGKYDEAIAVFEALNGYKDSAAQIAKCEDAIQNTKYSAAVELYNEGKYDEAIAAFEALNGYKDSAAQIAKCENAKINIKYNAAVELYKEEKYDEAIAAFEALNGYKDSAAQIAKCENAIQNTKYSAAVELYNEGKYDEAIAAFEALNGYKDSAAKVTECLSLKQISGLKNVKVGSTIKFGFYEQDNNTSNGKEEIEWIVLAVNGKKALIISQYALDCKTYNYTNRIGTTWEKCALRTWLNDTFYDTAFGADHQKMIISSTVTADKNPSYITSPGNDTTDKVFLLSITEVNEYFSSDSARQCSATAYAKAQGTVVYYENHWCWWWLRSPGKYSDYAACVDFGGYVWKNGESVIDSRYSVRPAL